MIAIDRAVEPDLLETYMIANSVSLVVLPERTPLQATGLSVGRDIDAFAWQFSAQLFGRTSLNRVRPDAGGPKTMPKLGLPIPPRQQTGKIDSGSVDSTVPSAKASTAGFMRPIDALAPIIIQPPK